jgi:hypothetical protein
MKIWLDDIRPEPFPLRDHRESYPFDRYAPYDVVCVNAEQAIALINLGQVTFISFDHDLGQGKTGYDVAKHIEEGAVTGTITTPIYYKCHSANPVGKENICAAMDNAWRHWAEKSVVQFMN